MKKWQHVVRDARLIYINRDRFAYLYGANGECPKSYSEAYALVDRLWNAYPAHFNEYVINRGHTKKELAWHVVNRICLDCSSFICYVTQTEGDIFNLRVTKDMNSTMLHNSCTFHTSLANGLWGSLLWKSGHVGLDVGNGLCIHLGCEFADVEEYRFIDPNSPVKFADSSPMPWVDYTGSINL